MPEIKILPPSLINKIAAGEVIERPSSVVKEIVENALDAGAKKIEIDIEKAGSDLIRVSDDGCGMRPEQLKLAVTQHATSKISETDDLFRIGSFGFRGEALASIAEVSQLVVRSCAEGAEHGAELRVEGGKPLSEPAPCGMRRGTTIEVRNLFFNTPVRRKFLKGALTEFGHISEAVVRLAIPNTDVHFVLRHNGRIVYDLPPSAGMRERISRAFGPEFAAKLIPIEAEGEGVRISGYIGHPDLTRSNYSCQYFFLNRRFIRDKSLQHALVQAYRGMLMVGRYPVAFLDLPSCVDGIAEYVPGITPYRWTYALPPRIVQRIFGGDRSKATSWPIWRRWGNMENQTVKASEYTVWETIGPAASVTAYLTDPTGTPPPVRPEPAKSLRDLEGYWLLP